MQTDLLTVQACDLYVDRDPWAEFSEEMLKALLEEEQHREGASEEMLRRRRPPARVQA
jgi:hypothetical protein